MQNYPHEPHVRKHGPSGFVRYQSYKPWLRDEFTYRCVYCLERETWYPNGHFGFGVDHILPKAIPKYGHLECDYKNLIYACNRCNTAKSTKVLLDPTVEAFGDHCKIDDDGKITGITRRGRFLIKVLGLDTDEIRDTRQQYHRIETLYQRYPDDEEIAELYHSAFGYPRRMHDLRRYKPTENSKPEGAENCYFVQRANDKLDRVCVV